MSKGAYFQKKGFTLLELLAVLVILASLASIAAAVFLNKGDEARFLASKVALENLNKQGQAYLFEKETSYPAQDILPNMINSGYIKETPANQYQDIKNYTDKTYVVSVDSNGRVMPKLLAGVNTTYNCNKPDMVEGMVPIKWNESVWIDTTESDTSWYAYNGNLPTLANEKWANVRLADGSKFVWIPRYTYKITLGYHSSTTGTVMVKYSKNLADDLSDGYKLHPAFKFGGTELTGIWVAKYEASPVEGVGNSNALDNVITKHVQVKPSVSSWRYICINNAFIVCRNMMSDARYGFSGKKNILDTHMMKNMEWGAVAYLTQAIRGNSNEMAVSMNVSYTAGAGGVTTSTTGNETGIYDLSGAAVEFVAAYIANNNPELTASGAELANASNSKYVDVYPSNVTFDKSSTWANANSTNARAATEANYELWSSIYGDAVYEVSGLTGYWIETPFYAVAYPELEFSWFGDYNVVGWYSYIFFQRGGYRLDSTNAGIFGFRCNRGNSNSTISFRPCIVALP